MGGKKKNKGKKTVPRSGKKKSGAPEALHSFEQSSKKKKGSAKKRKEEEEAELELKEEEEEEEQEESGSVSGAIEWSFDDDDDEEEDELEEKKEKVYAQKKQIPPGVKKKMQELVQLINRLQKQLIQKEREVFEMRNNYNVVSADFAEMQEEYEWHKSENQKKDAIIDKYKKQITRLNEDFDKVNNRIREDKDDMKKKASSKVMKKVLDLMDSFDMAIEANEGKGELKEFLDGFKLIQKQMQHILDTEGVEPIEALDKAFDPKLHEAVDVYHDPSIPEDTVISVSKKGYLMHGEVLRPAVVKVSKGGPPREEEPKKEAEKKKEEPKPSKVPKGEKPDLNELHKALTELAAKKAEEIKAAREAEDDDEGTEGEDFEESDDPSDPRSESAEEGMWELDDEEGEEVKETEPEPPRKKKGAKSKKKDKDHHGKKKKKAGIDEFSELDELWEEEEVKEKHGVKKKKKKARK